MPSQEGNNFVFPRVFTRMAWSLQRESSGKRHGKRQRQGKNHFVIYYSNKDNSNFPNLPQRDKQINHNINISFNFIDYMVLFVFVSLDQHFSAEGLLWIVDSILMGQTKLPIIPPLILWTCTQNFCQFCDHLELIYQDNNGMGGIHGIQLIKCYPQFNVVDYPLETANGIQQWLINRQKRLKLWQNRMYHHGICQSWFSEEKVSI